MDLLYQESYDVFLSLVFFKYYYYVCSLTNIYMLVLFKKFTNKKFRFLIKFILNASRFH